MTLVVNTLNFSTSDFGNSIRVIYFAVQGVGGVVEGADTDRDNLTTDHNDTNVKLQRVAV